MGVSIVYRCGRARAVNGSSRNGLQIFFGLGRCGCRLGSLLLLHAFFTSLLASLLAFQRGHRRFWPILGLNVLLAPVQSTLLQILSPIPMSGLSTAEGLWVSFCYLMGPGWLALLWWALRPVPSPDARLLAFRQTKVADTLAGLPPSKSYTDLDF